MYEKLIYGKRELISDVSEASPQKNGEGKIRLHRRKFDKTDVRSWDGSLG